MMFNLKTLLETKLSTPSLGITYYLLLSAKFFLPDFQLPLSGSLTELDTNTNKHIAAFQLPLSGSPSPIPGFSGSPRLSAAAPLRTNDS